jgi:pilus assembly protein CpaD
VSPTEMPVRKSATRSLARTLSVFALTAGSLVAASCNSTTGTSDVADMREFDYRQRHPILVSNEPEVFDMRVGMRGPALSREVETAIRQYVGEYHADGTGSITIQVPTGSANAVAAASTGHAVHYALVRAGVPRGQIEVAPYEVGDHSKVATLRISYLRVKAVVPTCGLWPSASDTNFENTETYNFGCAGQQNLAAMVANPADLLMPRQMTSADGNRRADVISKYRRGEDPKSNIMLIDSDLGNN